MLISCQSLQEIHLHGPGQAWMTITVTCSGRCFYFVCFWFCFPVLSWVFKARGLFQKEGCQNSDQEAKLCVCVCVLCFRTFPWSGAYAKYNCQDTCFNKVSLSTFGLPKAVKTDQGTNFTLKLSKEVFVVRSPLTVLHLYTAPESSVKYSTLR